MGELSFFDAYGEEANITRSTTPTPGNPDGKDEKRTFRSGLLIIRVIWVEGVSMPAGVSISPAVQSALSSQQAKGPTMQLCQYALLDSLPRAGGELLVAGQLPFLVIACPAVTLATIVGIHQRN